MPIRLVDGAMNLIRMLNSMEEFNTVLEEIEGFYGHQRTLTILKTLVTTMRSTLSGGCRTSRTGMWATPRAFMVEQDAGRHSTQVVGWET